jgi:hypothetical protein
MLKMIWWHHLSIMNESVEVRKTVSSRTASKKSEDVRSLDFCQRLDNILSSCIRASRSCLHHPAFHQNHPGLDCWIWHCGWCHLACFYALSHFADLLAVCTRYYHVAPKFFDPHVKNISRNYPSDPTYFCTNLQNSKTTPKHTNISKISQTRETDLHHVFHPVEKKGTSNKHTRQGRVRLACGSNLKEKADTCRKSKILNIVLLITKCLMFMFVNRTTAAAATTICSVA